MKRATSHWTDSLHLQGFSPALWPYQNVSTRLVGNLLKQIQGSENQVGLSTIECMTNAALIQGSIPTDWPWRAHYISFATPAGDFCARVKQGRREMAVAAEWGSELVLPCFPWWGLNVGACITVSCEVDQCILSNLHEIYFAMNKSAW